MPEIFIGLKKSWVHSMVMQRKPPEVPIDPHRTCFERHRPKCKGKKGPETPLGRLGGPLTDTRRTLNTGTNS